MKANRLVSFKVIMKTLVLRLLKNSRTFVLKRYASIAAAIMHTDDRSWSLPSNALVISPSILIPIKATASQYPHLELCQSPIAAAAQNTETVESSRIPKDPDSKDFRVRED